MNVEQKRVRGMWRRRLGIQRFRENCIKLDTGNSITHEFCKFLLGWMDGKKSIPFIQEAEIPGGKVDHFRLADGQIIEIAHSETKKGMELKMSKYPSSVDMEFYSPEAILDWFEYECPHSYKELMRFLR